MPDGVVLLADRWYPTRPVGRAGRPCSSARPYGRARHGPARPALRGARATRWSCRAAAGRSAPEGEFVPVRNEQADGHATLEWVAAQPWFDGRLVMWGASYLGMTQWAIARGRARLRQGAQPPGHRVELPRRRRLPGRFLRARDGAGLAVPDQAPGTRVAAPCCARSCAAAGWWRRPSDVLPLGKCDAAAIGEPVPVFQDWLEHSAPGDPWWDDVDFGRRLEQGAAGQLRRRLVRPLPARRRWPTTRRCAAPARTARLTIGPWTHASPGLFGETRPRRARLVRRAARRAARQGAAGAGARLRHGVADVAGVLPVAAGGGDTAVVPRALGHARHRAAGRERARPLPLQPARPDAGRGWRRRSTSPRRGARTSAGASTATTSSPTPAPCSPRTSPSSAR